MSKPPGKRDGPARLRKSATSRISAGSAPASDYFISAGALKFLHGLASSPTSAKDALTLLHELQVYQVELDMQTEQIESNARELEEDLGHYRELYNKAPFGYFVVTNAWYVIEANKAGADLFDIELGFIEGCKISNFFSSESQQSFIAAMASLANGSKSELFKAHLAASKGAHLLTAVVGPLAKPGVCFLTLVKQ